MTETIDFRQQHICWTTSPITKEGLETLPYVELVGYQQTWSDLIQSINYWLTRVNDGGNPYKGLYMGKEIRTYILPYFNEYHHNISQSWQENQGPAGQLVKQITDVVETAAKAVLPAAGILFPKSYAGSTGASYQFSFTLINTNAGNDPKADIAANIKKNKKFLNKFIRDNLHDQNNALSVVPPLIYEVFIPGVRWSPAAVISGLTVLNKGTMNRETIPNADGDIYIYPDAWEVQVTIQELINESKRIFDDATYGTDSGRGTSTRIFA